MTSCGKCTFPLEGQDGIECSKCRKHFHLACNGLAPEARNRIAEDLQQGKYWLCQTCVGKISLFSVYAHPDVTRLKLEIVAEVQLSVQQCIAAVQLKADTTAEELGALRLKQDSNFLDISKRLQALELEQSTHIQETSFKFDDIHRHQRRDEVVILRVPFKEEENLQTHFKAILTALELPLDKYSNVMVRRISRTNPQAATRPKVTSPPIVVAFESKFKRNEFMKAYFMKKDLSLRDLGFPSGDRVPVGTESFSIPNGDGLEEGEKESFSEGLRWNGFRQHIQRIEIDPDLPEHRPLGPRASTATSQATTQRQFVRVIEALAFGVH